MRNAGRESPDGGETVAHADFLLETPDLGQVIESVDLPNETAASKPQTGNRDGESFLFTTGRNGADLASPEAARLAGKWIDEEFLNLPSLHCLRIQTQQPATGGIDQLDVSFEVGCDHAAADGIDDIGLQY